MNFETYLYVAANEGEFIGIDPINNENLLDKR